MMLRDAAVTIPSSKPDEANWPRGWSFLLFAAIGIVFIFQYTHPINDGAKLILPGMKKRFHLPQWKAVVVSGCEEFFAGVEAFHKKDFHRAAEILTSAKNKKIIWSVRVLADALLLDAASDWENGRDRAARDAAMSAAEVRPDYLPALFDAAASDWYVSERQNPEKNGLYREPLEKFLRGSEPDAARLATPRGIARAILDGTYDGRPSLIMPQEPGPWPAQRR
jgi:hypothetical protein